MFTRPRSLTGMVAAALLGATASAATLARIAVDPTGRAIQTPANSRYSKASRQGVAAARRAAAKRRNQRANKHLQRRAGR